MKGDKLASGGKSAQFSVANSDKNDPIVLRNVAEPGAFEEKQREDREESEKRAQPRPQQTITARPLGDRVIVRRLTEDENAKSLIIIPDQAREKPQEGIVISVGPGRITDAGTRVTIDVVEGDHVLFGKYSGTEIRIKDEDLLILREEEVLVRL